MDDFLSLKVGVIWKHFWQEHFAFIAICGYIFFEYVRPQSIIPAIDFLPWSQLFILLAAGGIFLDKEKRQSKSAITGLFALFFVCILISCFTAYKPAISWRNLENIYTWLIIYFLMINIITTEKRFFIVMLIFIAANAKLSVFGAKTWAMRGFSFTSWGLKGPPGFFENSGEYAIEMCITFAVTFFFYRTIKPYVGKYLKYCFAILPVTAAMAVLGASSRGSQLALVAQLYFLFLHGKVTIKAITSVVIVVTAVYFMLPEEQKARFENAGEDRTSTQRLLYWGNGWEMMKEHPFTGVGYFNFPRYFEDFYPEDMLYPRAELAHNIFVQVGADLGFIGLGVYLLLIATAFNTFFKMRKRLQAPEDEWMLNFAKGLTLGFFGFLVAGQFVSVVYYPFMWMHLAFIVCLKTLVDKKSI